MRMGPGGLTLVEIIISIALVAMGIVFVMSLIPSSIVAMKRAENMQAATAYGLSVLEDARNAIPTDREFDVEINHTQFHVVRHVVPVDAHLSDIVVTVRWSLLQAPVVLGTRIQGSLKKP